jgi:hypothetical protein
MAMIQDADLVVYLLDPVVFSAVSGCEDAIYSTSELYEIGEREHHIYENKLNYKV